MSTTGMLSRSVVIGWLALACSWAWAGPIEKPDTPTPRVPGFDSAHILASSHFKTYTNVKLEDPQVEFDRQWLRQYSRDLSVKEREKIAWTYSEILQQSLKKALAKRLTVSAAADQDTLIIRTQLLDLVINAPEAHGAANKDVYVQYIGQARLQVELVDNTGKVLARLEDKGKTHDHSGEVLVKADRARNTWEFRQLTNRWADSLDNFLALN